MQFKKFQQGLFLLVLLLVTILFVWLINPYLIAIFWAIVLAIVFYPVKTMYLKLVNDHEITSVIMTMLTMVVIVIVPLYVLGLSLVNESVRLYSTAAVNPQQVVESVESFNQHVPVLTWMENLGVDRQELQTKISEGLKTFGLYIASSARSVGQSTLRFVVNFFIMLYLLYFFLRYGPYLLKRLQHLVPLGDKKEARLFTRFTSTVRATVKGTLIIGVLQGVVGGVLFWIVGIPAPVLWGAVMGALSIIPAVGSFVIWGPAGIILLATGQLWQGILVLVIGSVVISLIDNILRPPLVGKDTQMPDAVILLSTLGGLSLFGISGFVIGPIIAAFFLSFWGMFEEEYSKELQKSG